MADSGFTGVNFTPDLERFKKQLDNQTKKIQKSLKTLKSKLITTRQEKNARSSLFNNTGKFRKTIRDYNMLISSIRNSPLTQTHRLYLNSFKKKNQDFSIDENHPNSVIIRHQAEIAQRRNARFPSPPTNANILKSRAAREEKAAHNNWVSVNYKSPSVILFFRKVFIIKAKYLAYISIVYIFFDKNARGTFVSNSYPI